MLHLRLVVPTDLREPVLDRLDRDPTVCDLTILSDRARRPDGTVVLLDLPVEAANPLLDDLKELGLAREGAIILQHTETAISGAAEEAERLAHGDPAHAVIWDEVAQRLGDEADLSASFLAFMLSATLIGAVAVLTDSPILVIGAMVVGPEFGPLAAMMLAVHRRRWGDLRRAATTLVVGFALGGLAALALTAVLQLAGQVPATYVAGSPRFTRYISHPDEFTVLVAVLAGMAGVLSLTEDRAGTLVGVVISATTIPALADVGVGAALGHHREALGALVQLVTNVGCLLTVGIVTLMVQEWALRRHGEIRYPPPSHHRRVRRVR